MTTLRKSAGIISASTLLTLALTLSAAAQCGNHFKSETSVFHRERECHSVFPGHVERHTSSFSFHGESSLSVNSGSASAFQALAPMNTGSRRATRILTVYCPSDATVSIGGHGTATRGPVRQYVLNFPVHMNAGFDVYVDITGLVGDEQRSVSRKVPLIHDQLNYIARFHPVPKQKTTTVKKSAPAPARCAGCPPAAGKLKKEHTPESSALSALDRRISDQETEIAQIKATAARETSNWKRLAAELAAMTSKAAPIALDVVPALTTVNAAKGTLGTRKMELAAVMTLDEQHSVSEVQLQTEIKLRTRDTIASNNARDTLVKVQAALAGIRLQASQIKQKINEQVVVVREAEAALQAIEKHNQDVADGKYTKDIVAKQKQVAAVDSLIATVGKQLKTAELKLTGLLKEAHELRKKRSGQ